MHCSHLSVIRAFTPHARGSTHIQAPGAHYFHVYPACAGIDPSFCRRLDGTASLPRMRGDRPYLWRLSTSCSLFTPHARGSTLPGHHVLQDRAVYPHARGTPTYLSPARWSAQFTPHARGSTLITMLPDPRTGVYPACAGIDRSFGVCLMVVRGLPRMRGDRPPSTQVSATWCQFTPHARGSTLLLCHILSRFVVYPACAGIDRVHRHAG